MLNEVCFVRYFGPIDPGFVVGISMGKIETDSVLFLLEEESLLSLQTGEVCNYKGLHGHHLKINKIDRARTRNSQELLCFVKVWNDLEVASIFERHGSITDSSDTFPVLEEYHSILCCDDYSIMSDLNSRIGPFLNHD